MPEFSIFDLSDFKGGGPSLVLSTFKQITIQLIIFDKGQMVIQNITINVKFPYLCMQNRDNSVTMAMKIKSVPVLNGDLAIKFIAQVDKNASKIANTKDYTEQVNKSQRILDKAKLLK